VDVEYAGKWSAVMSVVSKSAESRTGQSLSLPAYSIAGLAGVSFRHEHLAAIRGQDVFFDVRAVNYRGRPRTIRRSRETVIAKSAILGTILSAQILAQDKPQEGLRIMRTGLRPFVLERSQDREAVTPSARKPK
jgi:hypothetical protein